MILFNLYLGDQRVHAFLKGVCPKVIVIMRLEFELAIQRVCQDATKISSINNR